MEQTILPLDVPSRLSLSFKIYFNSNREPIQIDVPHIEEPVTPGHDKWEEAKYVVRSSVITEITAIDHLLYAHLTVSNGGTRGATEHLGSEHPLRRFLKPFTFRANKINDQASRSNLKKMRHSISNS